MPAAMTQTQRTNEVMSANYNVGGRLSDYEALHNLADALGAHARQLETELAKANDDHLSWVRANGRELEMALKRAASAERELATARAENVNLKRECHDWWTAANGYSMDKEELKKRIESLTLNASLQRNVSIHDCIAICYKYGEVRAAEAIEKGLL